MPPVEPTHKLYLDDSGTKEYSADRRYSVAGGKTPYFVFGGLLVPTNSAGNLATSVSELKRSTFGTADVEVKANWLKRPQERQKRYLEKYEITDEALTSFVESTYELIRRSEIQLLACTVDKAEVQAKYPKPYYAPAIAYECVLQRAQSAMSECDGLVHVTVDDMSGATPKGSQYKENLRKHHKRLRSGGSSLRNNMTMDRLGGLTFSDSKSDERLQLADLIASATYRQFVDYGRNWEDNEAERLPLYPYFARIAERFRHDPHGRIQGYGVVKFPLNNRVYWVRPE